MYDKHVYTITRRICSAVQKPGVYHILLSDFSKKLLNYKCIFINFMYNLVESLTPLLSAKKIYST